MISNAAPLWGGGAYGSTLNNCTVVGNYGGQQGAGIYGGSAYNSILFDNYKFGGVIENFGARYWWEVTLAYCCTTPMPGNGWANFTDAPQFVNPAAGNFRLQPPSPCIDVGNNGYAYAGSTDLDGNRRIMGTAVDVGAYEFVPANLAAFNQWLQSYNLPVDGSADFSDSDNDGLNNWQEYIAGTAPTGR
ncbi:MAG TPA: choice-of-anchor Q domain-containing protein [Verrucomicrobiae bacterium]|nr:choice-of-anchor Q domain-containing protein [Verrucomicrobiae bacterium]